MQRLWTALRALAYMAAFVLGWGWLALQFRPFGAALLPTPSRTFGVSLMIAGGALVLTCAAWFVAAGRGTPAPFDAPRSFVPGGPYRWVRNPIYLGGLATLAGFGFWHRSPSMVALTLPAFALFHGLVVGYEEPTLRRRFGAPYAEYLRRVNRWIPKPPRSGGASDGADGGRAGPAVSPAAGPADNVAVDTPVEHSANQAWWQRAIAGLLALPLTAYSLMFAAALLRGRFDPLGAIFGSCAGTLAVLCWWFALRGHIAESRRRMRLALLGGLILGGIGFVAGFFGPILLSPGANQGPLLGIFVTGPLGFVVGTAAGWIYGRTRKDGAQESVPGRRAA